MPCGCSGSGQWQADGYVPAGASNIHDPANFWHGDDLVVPSSEAPPTGYASWSAEHGTTHAPPAAAEE